MTDGGDLGELLAHMSELQANLAQLQQASASSHLEGNAGNGAVRIVVTGEFDVVSVHLDPSVIDPDAADLLEDLVMAALRRHATKVNEARKAAVNVAMGSALSALLDPSSTAADSDPSAATETPSD